MTWTHNQTEFVLRFAQSAEPTRKAVEDAAGGPMPDMPAVIALELSRITAWGVYWWLRQWSTIHETYLFFKSKKIL